MIEISNLSKSYGKSKVLGNLNLSLPSGKIIGIVGANGAGKSTLFKCIHGTETFEGSITSEFENLRTKIGMLETNPIMLSMITGEEYLILHCNARKLPVPDLKDMNMFDLPLKKFASNYSTGMKKKLALTAILIQNNEVFILDEPFNGVDLQSNLKLKSTFLKLREEGKTVLISSHIFSTLSEICDEIHLIQNGGICMSADKSTFGELEAVLAGS
ncbi:MAG TPA: ABC transporter ATP-binding protein [Flavobacteriales bacterium]|nr:ABC transporter ATP-binding protein [Flavobacteriales bacterium]|tara:strand:+ start:1097 stop:1741 length:645 start_codon:yes stop_codon:yes gene_type:complete